MQRSTEPESVLPLAAAGRHRTTAYDDDGAFIHLSFTVATGETNLGRAYDAVRMTCAELEETAGHASDEIGKQLAALAARLSGWDSESLDALVQAVDNAPTTDEKGRSLEELCSRLFETVPDFTVSGRTRTVREEIDLSMLNDSPDPRLRRESALLLAECKHWTGNAGRMHSWSSWRRSRTGIGDAVWDAY